MNDPPYIEARVDGVPKHLEEKLDCPTDYANFWPNWQILYFILTNHIFFFSNVSLDKAPGRVRRSCQSGPSLWIPDNSISTRLNTNIRYYPNKGHISHNIPLCLTFWNPVVRLAMDFFCAAFLVGLRKTSNFGSSTVRRDRLLGYGPIQQLSYTI